MMWSALTSSLLGAFFVAPPLDSNVVIASRYHRCRAATALAFTTPLHGQANRRNKAKNDREATVRTVGVIPSLSMAKDSEEASPSSFASSSSLPTPTSASSGNAPPPEDDSRAAAAAEARASDNGDDNDNSAQTRALWHVLKDVCRFDNDSAVVEFVRRGEVTSVDELCDMSDAAIAALASGDVITASSCVKARRIAVRFVESITNRVPEPILASDDGYNKMQVMRNVVNLTTGDASDIVIRNVTRPFWQACIDEVNTPDMKYRVGVAGTPGIGKTASTALLIQMLLVEQRCTVVYRICTAKRDGHYYEFIPGLRPDDPVRINVYPEKSSWRSIATLNDPPTFYVMDAGDTNCDCLPSLRFEGKIILVASTNSEHWSGKYFERQRGDAVGILMVFPLWELNELLQDRPVLGPTMTPEMVSERYHLVGGVPLLVFDTNGTRFHDALKQQAVALEGLDVDQTMRVATSRVETLERNNASEPHNSLIGFRASYDDTRRFSSYAVDVISPSVGAALFRGLAKGVQAQWSLPHSIDFWLFEAYCMYLLGTGQSTTFRCKSHWGSTGAPATTTVVLGGCREVRTAWNVVAAAKMTPCIVYHPCGSNDGPLDFVYRDDGDEDDSENHFHAFVVAPRSQRARVSVAAVRKLAQTAAAGCRSDAHWSLYYLVPDFSFDSFQVDVSNAKRPRDDDGTGTGAEVATTAAATTTVEPPAPQPPEVRIFHVSIPIPPPMDDDNLEHQARQGATVPTQS